MLPYEYAWVDLNGVEVQALIPRVRAGSREARTELFEASLWVVGHVVRRLGDAARGCGVEDAEMEGCVALLKAIDGFSASRRAARAYGAYVYKRVLYDLQLWIRKETCRGVNYGPGNTYKNAIGRAAARFSAEHGRAPRVDELIDSPELPRPLRRCGHARRARAIAGALAAAGPAPLSLNAPAASGEDEEAGWEPEARAGCIWLDESRLEQSERREGLGLALAQMKAERRHVVERLFDVLCRGGEVWDAALELARTEGRLGFSGYRAKIYRALATLRKDKRLREVM